MGYVKGVGCRLVKTYLFLTGVLVIYSDNKKQTVIRKEISNF